MVTAAVPRLLRREGLMPAERTAPSRDRPLRTMLELMRQLPIVLSQLLWSHAVMRVESSFV